MASIRYAPVGPVLTLRLSPLSLLVALTEAPAIAAPVLSVTVPAIMPRLVCAKEGSGANRNPAETISNTASRRLRIFSIPRRRRIWLTPVGPPGRFRDAFLGRESCSLPLFFLHSYFGSQARSRELQSSSRMRQSK